MISGRQDSTMQRKKFHGKGCILYSSHVLGAIENDTPRLEEFHVLQQFRDVYRDEIPRIPPKSDINFTFEPVLGATPVSQTPCRMSIP